MPSLEEFLESSGSTGFSLEDFLDRPSPFERGVTQAKSRTATLSEFAESPWVALANPGAYVGKKVRELVGLDFADRELEVKREEWKRQAAELPEARGGWEKAADIIGSAVPDVALGVATAPIAGLGATAAAGRGAGSFASVLAGEALQSAALAPIEFGTRDPKSALLNTLIAPAAGTLLNRGVARLLGRGAKEIATSPDTDLLALQKLKMEQLREGATPYPTTSIKEIGGFEPRAPVVQEPFTPVRQALWEQMPTEGTPYPGFIQDLRPAVAAQLPEEKLFVSPEELIQDATRVDQELMLKAPPDLGLEQQLALPLSFQTSPPVPKKLRTYYMTPDGRVHTNAVPGATKVRAASRAAARATLESPPPEQFSRLEGIKAAQRLKDALIAGRALPSDALMELDDETISQVARDANKLMFEKSLAALQRAGVENAGELAQDVSEAAGSLPPRTNVEIADALDTLSPEQQVKMIQKLKGKGTCPL